MNLFKQLPYLLIICCLFILSACESNNHLRSEKKIKSEIQGTWKLVYLTLDTIPKAEYWTFNNDILYVRKNTDGIIEQDTGIYKIETTWKEPYVTISEADLINSPPLNLNGKWTIIELDSDILFITIRPQGSGLEQREFIKQ